jgi:ABC-type transport system involved in multi-copper enzyme maturation permease subunit
VPVYPQTYRHYTGAWQPRSMSWTVIAQKGIIRLWRNKGIRFILMATAVFFMISVSRLYIAANLELIEFLGITGDIGPGIRIDDLRNTRIGNIFTINESFYYDFFGSVYLAFFFIALLGGSGAISSDKRSKAMMLYLSKPITSFDYIFGKAAFVLFFLYCVSLLPAMLLMFLHAFFNENWSYLITNIPLALKIFAYANIVAIPLTIISLALSSLFKSNEASGAFFAAIYWLPDVLIQAIRGLLGRFLWGSNDPELWSLLSLSNIWHQIGTSLFTDEPAFQLHWGIHLIALIVICAFFSFILYRQIRAVEVVS